METRDSLTHSLPERHDFGNLRRKQNLKRKKILGHKKVAGELIKVACAQKDHLSPFPAFCHYNRDGLSLYLQSGSGDKLSFPVKKYIQSLLKINMEGPYGSQWPSEEKIKHREMVSTQARYIFVHEASDANANGMSSKSDEERTAFTTLDKKDPIIAFAHFRFIIEEMIPVLYLYELQIERRVQGRGLGKFLMELIELIACKNSMGAVVFTVQKANFKALNFYQNIPLLPFHLHVYTRRYMMRIETGYEILCKAFNEEAKAVLEGEVNIDGIHTGMRESACEDIAALKRYKMSETSQMFNLEEMDDY